MIFLLGATGRKDRCRSRKVQSAPDRKRSRLLNQGSLWQGGLLQLELCDENTQEAFHTHALRQDFNTADI